MAFSFKISPQRRAEGRYVADVGKALQIAFAEAKERARQNGMSFPRAELARRLGIDRAVVSRRLSGDTDMKISTLAGLAHAMGGRIEAPRIVFEDTSNEPNTFHIRTAKTVNTIHYNDMQPYKSSEFTFHKKHKYIHTNQKIPA